MNKWEYVIDTIAGDQRPSDYYSEHEYYDVEDKMQWQLDNRGCDGWELVSVAAINDNEYRLFFKRPKKC